MLQALNSTSQLLIPPVTLQSVTKRVPSHCWRILRQILPFQKWHQPPGSDTWVFAKRLRSYDLVAFIVQNNNKEWTPWGKHLGQRSLWRPGSQIRGCKVESQLLLLIPDPGRHHGIAQAVGFLLPMQETYAECWIPGLGMAQSQLWHALGCEQEDGRFVFSNSQNNKTS